MPLSPAGGGGAAQSDIILLAGSSIPITVTGPAGIDVVEVQIPGNTFEYGDMLEFYYHIVCDNTANNKEAVVTFDELEVDRSVLTNQRALSRYACGQINVETVVFNARARFFTELSDTGFGITNQFSGTGAFNLEDVVDFIINLQANGVGDEITIVSYWLKQIKQNTALVV